MLHRPGKNAVARAARQRDWHMLPDRVFADLGASRADIAEFAKGLLGPVMLPGESAFSLALRSSFQTVRDAPKIVVYCEVEADVRRCLDWANRHGWWVVPRSGGHSTAGYSVNTGMVIDVSRMNAIYVDPATLTVTVGAGTNFGTLNAVLNSYRLHVPGGVCEDVGVAGYMQGGGYGYTSRLFGMNCDNVVAFRMMLRDGRTVRADAATNADLYWAVRGGTGNNFGILLNVTYRLHRLWDVWAFSYTWRREDAPAALAAMQAGYMGDRGSPKLGYMGIIANRADYGGEAMLMMRGLYAGPAEEGRAELAPLLAVGDPITEADTVQPYYTAEKVIDEVGLLDLPWDRAPKEDKQAGYISRQLSEADWKRVLDFFADTTPLPYNVVCFEPYGGVINQHAPDECAFVHRDADLDFFVDSFWTEPEEEAKARGWLDDYMRMMAEFFNGEVYQNYPRRGLDDARRRYFGGNLDRLLAVKRKYDPSPHAFHFEQGLATSRDDACAPADGETHAAFTAPPIIFEAAAGDSTT